MISCIEKLIYKFCVIFGKFSTNLKTTISQRSLKNLGLLLLLFEFNSFSFLIDISDNIITTSGSRDQNSHQCHCSIIVIQTQLCDNDTSDRTLKDLNQLLKSLGFTPFHFSFAVRLSMSVFYINYEGKRTESLPQT